MQSKSDWLRRPWPLTEIFAVANLAFLAADVFIAHSVNRFEQPAEWVPVAFSIVAPVVLVIAAAMRRHAQRASTLLGLLVGWCALGVGIAGMLFHLGSHFFQQESVRNLVYTAPFIAPLAYSGLGLLLIMNRMVPAESREWALWVIVLALGGFAGNFGLTLADHAQNAFFNPIEWVAVAASAVAVGFLAVLVFRPGDRFLLRSTLAVLALEFVVGILGCALHIGADFALPGRSLWEQFLYGAPLFAPLLFPNLALLAAIGVWALWPGITADSAAAA